MHGSDSLLWMLTYNHFHYIINLALCQYIFREKINRRSEQEILYYKVYLMRRFYVSYTDQAKMEK